MSSFSISFAFFVLLLAIFIGSALGSLLGQVFGLDLLNYRLFRVEANDFYIIEKLRLAPTPGAIIGFLVAVWILYKKKVH